MTAPDINEIVKHNGVDTGRAVMDGSVPFKPNEDVFFRELLEDVVGRRRRKPINLDPKPVNLNAVSSPKCNSAA
jgi:hypothetical protein